LVYNSVQLSPTVAGLSDFYVSLSETDEIPTAAESRVAVCTEFFLATPFKFAGYALQHALRFESN